MFGVFVFATKIPSSAERKQRNTGRTSGDIRASPVNPHTYQTVLRVVSQYLCGFDFGMHSPGTSTGRATKGTCNEAQAQHFPIALRNVVVAASTRGGQKRISQEEKTRERVRLGVNSQGRPQGRTRNVLPCQKRPTIVSKESYYSVKRDLL